jgi:membrane protease subunit HflC
VLTAAVLVAVLVAWMITFQVSFYESVVKIRLGKAGADSVLDGREPGGVGLHFKLPPPFERIRRVDMRLRVLDTLETEVKTQDGQNVQVSVFALWRVKDPLVFTTRIPNDPRAIEQLTTRVSQARSEVIGAHRLSDLVNLDSELVSRTHEEIQQSMVERVAPSALKDYGVEIVQIGIRRISLPPEATAKVQEAMIAERNNIASRYEQEGKSLAASIKARAGAAKQSILDFAQRKAAEIESEGTRASTRILAQIEQQDQELFIWLRRLEAVSEALKTKTTIFLDWNSEMSQTFSDPSLRPTPPGAEPREVEGAAGGN